MTTARKNDNDVLILVSIGVGVFLMLILALARKLGLPFAITLELFIWLVVATAAWGYALYHGSTNYPSRLTLGKTIALYCAAVWVIFWPAMEYWATGSTGASDQFAFQSVQPLWNEWYTRWGFLALLVIGGLIFLFNDD